MEAKEVAVVFHVVVYTREIAAPQMEKEGRAERAVQLGLGWVSISSVP
jgi:hypothetical protein